MIALVSGWSGSRELSWAAGACAGVGFEPGSTASAYRGGAGGLLRQRGPLGKEDRPIVESCLGRD